MNPADQTKLGCRHRCVRYVRQAAADGRLPCLRLPYTRAVRFDADLVKAWARGRGMVGVEGKADGLHNP